METQVIKHSRFYNQLMQSPALKLLIDETAKKLDKEQKLREKFYDGFSPDVKAEFINGKVIRHSPVKLRHSQASDNFEIPVRAIFDEETNLKTLNELFV